MIAALAGALDSLFGRGEAAVTVPPLDGALRPNRMLDEAPARVRLDDADCLAERGDRLLASAGSILLAADEQGAWQEQGRYASPIAALCSVGGEGLAVALENGEVLVEGGRFDRRRYRAGPVAGVGCITALASDGAALFVANGSATNPAKAWQRDLLERNASGSIWRIDLADGNATPVAEGLAWPGGLVVDGETVVVAEAWQHRLLRVEPGLPDRRQTLHADLPGYPGRIAKAAGGWWLALFAPRSQLVEFVLREPGYRRRMMAEVPEPFWVAPKLRSGRSFYESLQGGGVKHLGMLKPWAPTMSAGLCVKLDAAFQPRFSLQSRADGHTHGVTGIAEHRGRVHVAARGDGVIVSLPLSQLPDAGGGDR